MSESQKCILCGLETADLLTIDSNSVCAECKPSYIQGLKEGKFGRKKAVPGRSGKRAKGIATGVGIGIALQVIAGLVWFAWAQSGIHGYTPLIALAFCGAVQLTYMLPAIIISAVLRKKGIVIGLIIIMLSVIILNAGCYGMLFISSGI